MQLKGEIVFEYENRLLAGKVARLIQIDNEIVPKTLRVRTTSENTMVTTTIESEKASTFFSTLDDLISSEKLITEIIAL